MKKTDRTISDSAMPHPLQSAAWGEFRKAMGVDVVRLWRSPEPFGPELRVEGLVEGQLTFHPIPFTPFTVGYFPKGPMPTKQMVKELTALGKRKRAVFIQLEPNVLSGCQLSAVSCQLIPSHHPLFTKYTFVLDLTKSEEKLLQAMHPKTRYNIRVAQKHGVTVAEDNSSTTFDQYLQLVKETTQRQEFYAHNDTYHRTMWKVLHKAGIAKLFTASYQGSTLAAWIIFAWRDTVYYPYGASGRDHREVMAPNLLLWEIARWAKKQGFKKFDLWGALGPDPDVNDPWYGFHRFKQGFNPNLVEFIGSYDLVINPFFYHLYTVADTLRWTYLKLKKKIFS